MKGRIPKEWSKLWSKAMGPQLAKTCKRAMIHTLWNKAYILWLFRNNEDHKNDKWAVAEYKQKELDEKLVSFTFHLPQVTSHSIPSNAPTSTSNKTHSSSCYMASDVLVRAQQIFTSVTLLLTMIFPEDPNHTLSFITHPVAPPDTPLRHSALSF
jgi:hypothetical protein